MILENRFPRISRCIWATFSMRCGLVVSLVAISQPWPLTCNVDSPRKNSGFERNFSYSERLWFKETRSHKESHQKNSLTQKQVGSFLWKVYHVSWYIWDYVGLKISAIFPQTNLQNALFLDRLVFELQHVNFQWSKKAVKHFLVNSELFFWGARHFFWDVG